MHKIHVKCEIILNAHEFVRNIYKVWEFLILLSWKHYRHGLCI